MASPPPRDPEMLADPNYAKACPDYKKYSTFMQYAPYPLHSYIR